LKEIRHYQSCTQNLIPHRAFAKLVRDITLKLGEYKYQAGALFAMQVVDSFTFIIINSFLGSS
jgi:histone H3/H4